MNKKVNRRKEVEEVEEGEEGREKRRNTVKEKEKKVTK